MRPRPRGQRGYALLIMLIVLVMGSLYSVVSQLDAIQAKFRRVQGTDEALKLAKEALLGYAATYRDDPTHTTEVFGYLPCPDTTGDGAAASTCGSAGQAAVGLLPYKTLGLPDLRDADGVCLWYAVAGTFKNNPATAPLNWDTQGQFDIVDSAGSALATHDAGDGGGAAVIFAAGSALSSQNRSASGSNPCQVDPSAVSGYLDGSYNFATAAAVQIKQGMVVDANGNVTNNDRLAWVTPREIFDKVVKRADFSNPLTSTPAGQINTLIDRIRGALELKIQNDIFNSTSTSLPINKDSYTPKPTGIYVGEVDSTQDVSLTNQTSYANYLTNWAEQFRVAVCDSLSSPCLDINNSGTANCRGALMFGGRTANSQPRTSAQKGSSLAILSNYFESGSNTGGLDVLKGSGRFVGNSAYASATPAADVGTCLGYGSYVSLAQNAAAFASGTVTSAGGSSAVASVSTGGTPSINLGSQTSAARSACIWYPTALPLGSSLRLYFKYRIDSTLTGSTPRGYVLAVADAATNSPYSTSPIMCGTSGSVHLGYAGAPASGTATVAGNSVPIASLSWSPSSGMASITTAYAHGFLPGDTVTIASAYPSGYNGTFTVSWSGWSTTQFRYTVAYPGPAVAGVAPPKLGLEFDMSSNSSRNDPSGQHLSYVYWGSSGDNNLAATTYARDGGDDNYHGDGVAGDGSQPLNPRNLSTTAATATPIATVAAARWDSGTKTATVTTAAPHGIATGQNIVVSDIGALGYKGTYTATVTDTTHFTVPIASDPGPYPYVATISAATWSGGTATITTSAAHGLSTGYYVTIANATPAAWNGTYAVTRIDDTHFSISLASNPSAYVSGGQVSYPLSWVNGATWSGGTVTMTTASAHNLLSNQYVTVAGILPSGYNGTYKVTRIDATHFSYSLTNPATNPGTYVSGGTVAVAGATSTVMSATAVTVADADWSSGTVTITTATAHGLSKGQTVYVSGVNPVGFNGVFVVSSNPAPTTTQFSYSLAVDPGGYSSGGTAAYATPASSTLSGLAWASTNGGTVTATTSAAHGLGTGQIVNIDGAYPAGYNGAYAVTVIDATHFSYALSSDPGGTFNATTFANPGIATVKSSDVYLPYSSMPYDTDIHVRLDITRSYDATKQQATVTLKAYVGDTFALAGNCALADFQNFSRDLSTLCPTRTPTIEQDGIVVNDVAGPALANVYFGFTTARSSSSGDSEGISITNLLLRSQ